MNDPIEHATGLEKKELLAKLAGNDDPFHMKAIKRGPSTKDNPTMVPSAFDARIMGCICEYHSINFDVRCVRKSNSPIDCVSLVVCIV